jgi:hypothetical protein
VGHRFPGGVVDAQDTWIEVEVHDARGRRLAQSGLAHERTANDTAAHVLRVLQVDETGTPLLLRETDRFRSPATNHTVAPRDVELVRYRFDVPRGLDARASPIRVTARLRHRSRNLELAGAACLESKTGRGAAFMREVAMRTGAPLDPCTAEPITEVAVSETWIGDGAGAVARENTLPPWRRLYGHALGFLHALQENVGEARPSLEKARLLLPPGDERASAMLVGAMAAVAIREGRTEEVLALLDEAETLAPGHPAIARARGQALGNVWRWTDSANALEQATLASPLDDALWGQLAIARGAAGDPAAALSAAAHGLRLAPRDTDALRIRALSLEGLDAGQDEIDLAREAFEQWRPPDDAPAIKNACAVRSAACALERVPVHVHSLMPN